MPNERKLVREGVVDDEDYREVPLGKKTYIMIGQPIGWLRQQIGVAMKGLSSDLSPESVDEDLLSQENILDLLGNRVYLLLYAFIGEDLMPEWEFNGYPTREAWQAGDYKREYDPGVKPSQVKKALIAGAELNEIDLLKHLGKLIGPSLVKGFVTEALMRSMDTLLPTSSSAATQDSQSETSSDSRQIESDGASGESQTAPTSAAGPPQTI